MSSVDNTSTGLLGYDVAFSISITTTVGDMPSNRDLAASHPAGPDPSARGSLRRLRSGGTSGEAAGTEMGDLAAREAGLEGGALRQSGAREYGAPESPPGVRLDGLRRSNSRRIVKIFLGW